MATREILALLTQVRILMGQLKEIKQLFKKPEKHNISGFFITRSYIGNICPFYNIRIIFHQTPLFITLEKGVVGI